MPFNRANSPFLSLANFKALAAQGISLDNYFSVTHPSEPNYVASVGGEYFGMQNDNLNNIPANVSSIVDLLESKCITWGEYQEDLPSTGFQGFQFLNPKTGANDYVRKHK
jgi:acid phosphatase